MWIGIPLGTILTPFPRLTEGGAGVRFGLGLVLVAYGLYGLTTPKLKLSLPTPALHFAAALTGVVTGFVTAATGIFIIPMVLFLQALGLEKDELVQALGCSFSIGTVALAATLGPTAAFAASTSLMGLGALAFALLGLAIGSAARGRMDQKVFRTVLFGLLVILGVLTLGKEVLLP
jgi:uncharacterized membrane protein YfcA